MQTQANSRRTTHEYVPNNILAYARYTQDFKTHSHATHVCTQATGFQHGGGVTMVVDYFGPDTGGRKMRVPSEEAVAPKAFKPSEWLMRIYKSSFNLYVSAYTTQLTAAFFCCEIFDDV